MTAPTAYTLMVLAFIMLCAVVYLGVLGFSALGAWLRPVGNTDENGPFR